MAEKNNPGDENSRKIKEKGNLVPCAACKHQRRRCQIWKCVLRSYFPSSEYQEFLAVNKIFGVSNITKKIQLDTLEERAEAARALKHVAMLWEEDPVHGASGQISRLIQEIRMLQQLLQQLQPGPLPNQHVPASVSSSSSSSSSSSTSTSARVACGICKHMRTKCDKEKCITWKFFPASENQIFSAAYKAFGISSILKIIQQLDSDEQRAAAAEALKHEGILWRDDPVRGPSGEISRLEQVKQRLKEEIRHRQQLFDQLQESPLRLQNQSEGTPNNEQSQAMMGNQDIRPCHGVEGYNGNSTNVGIGGHDHGVLQVEWSSRTEKSIDDQGGHNGNNTIGINIVAGEGGDVQIGGTPRTEPSFHSQGRHNGNTTEANVSGYDSGRIVETEAAGITESNTVNREGGRGNVAQSGSSSGSEQSIQLGRGYGHFASFPLEY